MKQEELLAAAMTAYKGNPKGLNTESEGLNWLRVPMERTLTAIIPMIEAEMRERLVEAWLRDARDVHFNKAKDDLTPTGRVAKWMRTVEL